MGGAIRVFTSVLKPKPKPAPVQVTQPQTEPKVETPADTAQTKADRQKLMGAGYGGSTIMSTAAGVEEEANVQKTILGGGRKKRIQA